MNQLEAMRETVAVANVCGMDQIDGFAEGCDYWHLADMLERAESEEFSESKLGRWLGWMQCAVVAAGIGLTLDDMKRINLRYKGIEDTE